MQKSKLFAVLHEFRKFISRGNVMDLAVAVIMGSAFTSIVNSIVKDMLTPLMGVFLGGIEFGDLAFTIGEAEIKYGSFIQATINFLIVAVVVFVLVTTLNKLQAKFLGQQKKKEKEQAKKMKEEVKLLTEIRDLLKKEAA